MIVLSLMSEEILNIHFTVHCSENLQCGEGNLKSFKDFPCHITHLLCYLISFQLV